jgi:transcriptional regulator with XRE-family HTH domain
VPAHGSPTVRRRRLAAELRRLRERAGFTGDEVADRLGWSASKISRIELHRTGIKQADLQRILDLYGVDGSHRADLLALGREARKKDWLETVSASLPIDYAAFLEAEAAAQSVLTWEPQVVPGLLQTEEYMRAVMGTVNAMFQLPPADLERRVEIRLLRQQVLRRQPPPLLSVVIDESVLHRRLGDAAVMRRQLESMAASAELPNVELRILPLAGNRLLGTSAFTYMTFPEFRDVPLRDMVTVEHLTGTYYAESDDEANKYRVTFSALQSWSLTPCESRELLIDVARNFWV